MKKKLAVLSGYVLAVALPVAAFAQGITTTGSTVYACDGNDIPSIICKLGRILNSLVPLLIVLGVVYFVYGVITYVVAGDEEAKTAGRDRIIYGVIGLAVIIGLWGLVRILVNTFGLNNTGNIGLPTVPVPGF